ncbi:MAG: IS110 family transposase [Chloroflexota bacterium]
MTNTTSLYRVGLDVHANQTHLCALDVSSGEVRRCRIEGPPEGVLPFLEELGEGTVAAYEAGPTGFGLSRVGKERGLDVRVIAPGLIPRAPADRVKTDRRDAERLARLLAAGELRFVRVPSVEEEHFRDLIRCREDLRGDRMRARHRILTLLLRQGLRYPGPGHNWTQRHHDWLGQIRFEDRAAQTTLLDYLGALHSLNQRATVLEATIAELAASGPFAEQIARLRCFRGIDTLSAAGLSAEIGDLRRFAKPGQLAGYLGITPSERTTDERRRQGSITKAGPTHARRLLIEVAQHSGRQPKVGTELRLRQEGQDPRVCEVAWRAQRRLHSRWVHLRNRRGKPGGKVVVACARELACFLWEAAVIE